MIIRLSTKLQNKSKKNGQLDWILKYDIDVITVFIHSEKNHLTQNDVST